MLTNARQLGVMTKCLFVFPPVDYVELSKRLAVLANALGLAPEQLPAVDCRGRRLIGLHFNEDGNTVLVGIDGRDDLAYQAMFESVGAKLTRRKEVPLRLPAGPTEPLPTVQTFLERFDPGRSYAVEPTAWRGLQYLALSAANRSVVWDQAAPDPAPPQGGIQNLRRRAAVTQRDLADAYRRIEANGKQRFDGEAFKRLYDDDFGEALQEDSVDQHIVDYSMSDVLTLAAYVELLLRGK